MMKPMNRYIILSLLIISLIPVSCRKGSGTRVETSGPAHGHNSASMSPFYISTKGGYYVNQRITFSCRLPVGLDAEWVFSDGYTTHEQSPVRTFTSTGIITVKVVINGDSSNANWLNPTLSIEIRKPYDPSVVRKMEGMRTWHVVEDSLITPYTDNYKILRRYEDTFAIQVLSDTSILVKGHTLTADTSQHHRGIAGDFYFFGRPAYLGVWWENVYYFYEQDSIVYASHPDQGGTSAGSHDPGFGRGITNTYYSHR